MKVTRYLAFCVIALAVVYASVCSPVFASIWESGKIVYTSRHGDLDICSMGPNGGGRAILTTNPADDYDPTWSPDGTEILFVSERGGQPDMYIMNANGSNQRRVRRNSGHRTSPTWAPDGRRIAYSWNEEDIYIYNRFTGASEFLVTGANPAWSPDGTHIAFISGGSRFNPYTGASLYVINVQTGTERRIVRGIADAVISEPAWGPQSNYIVFSWLWTTYDGIYSVPRWGGEATVLNWWGDHLVYSPAVAPYGGEILVAVYDMFVTETEHIYKVTRGTNNWQRLTSSSDSMYNDDPDWWHPSSFPIEPQASQLTTTWGELKKK